MRYLLLLVFMVLSLGCATGYGIGPESVAVRQAAALPAPNAAVDGPRDGPDYRIGTLDVLEVTVFGVEALSRTVRVGSDGRVSLPLAGLVQAAARTPHELEADIASRLGARYIENPQVTVFVREAASKRFTVEGAVSQPGVFPVVGRTSLLQAIATAQGLDRLADPGGIVVFRVIDGEKMAAVFDIREVRAGRVPDPQIYADDVVVVEQSGSRTAVRMFIETVPTFAVFSRF